MKQHKLKHTSGQAWAFGVFAWFLMMLAFAAALGL